MAFRIGQLIKAGDERKARMERQARDKFLYHEYCKFVDLKDFAEYFGLTMEEAIGCITRGRLVEEMGL